MFSRELIAASSRPLVLAILARGENYGYGIIRTLKEESKETIAWNEGMLYPMLHRMEEEGLVASRWQPSETGKRRKLYILTTEGRLALRVHKEQWEAVNNTLQGLWKQAPGFA